MDSNVFRCKITAGLVPKYKTGCWLCIGRSVRAAVFSRRRVSFFGNRSARAVLSGTMSQIPVSGVSCHAETVYRLNAIGAEVFAHHKETFFR